MIRKLDDQKMECLGGTSKNCMRELCWFWCIHPSCTHSSISGLFGPFSGVFRSDRSHDPHGFSVQKKDPLHVIDKVHHCQLSMCTIDPDAPDLTAFDAHLDMPEHMLHACTHLALQPVEHFLFVGQWFVAPGLLNGL